MSHLKNNLIARWLSWHFRIAPAKIIEVWTTFIKFNLTFFSVKILFKTLLSPWKKISEPYSNSFTEISKNLETLILNIFSRLIGFSIRVPIIIIGLLSTFLLFILGFLTLFVWLVFPVFILLSVIFIFL